MGEEINLNYKKKNVSKPLIKTNKFSNMTKEIWKETNELTKENRGISNITYNDIL